MLPKKSPVNQPQISDEGAQWNVPVSGGLIDLGRILTATHVELALADQADLEYLLQVSDELPEQSVKIGASVTAGGDATVELFAGTTFSAAGTDVPFFNRNFTSGKEARSELSVGPSITDDGTEIAEAVIPAGVRNREVGGALETGLPLIFGPGATVLIRITNISGGAQNFGFALDLLEIL